MSANKWVYSFDEVDKAEEAVGGDGAIDRAGEEAGGEVFARKGATGAGDVNGAAGGNIKAVPLEFGILEEGDVGLAVGGGA